ncbi:MAG TPA: DNA polymerase III subunit beta, partial [Rhodospirillales bacterium]|nr:DNA polymerase III subunit beta [Rhodospirillales bacterium]
KIKFAFEGTVLTSKLIDGTFPDYVRVIPENNEKVLEVETDVFAHAVDRVSAISTEKSRAIKLTITKGNLTLSANNQDNDTATEEVPADYDESEIEIGFNSRYLLDIAQQIEGDRARFTLADAASPTLVQDPDDQGAIYVLMPMRV